jgi:hypothetical protein
MTFGSPFVHVDDEGMRRAASQMAEAAEKMMRASIEMNETLTRFTERFSEEVTRMEQALFHALLPDELPEDK